MSSVITQLVESATDKKNIPKIVEDRISKLNDNDRSNLNKISNFEIHLPGHKFVGPNTNLTERIRNGDFPVSKLDEAAFKHDVYYSTGSDELRKIADLKLLNTALELLKASPIDPNTIAVVSAISAKIALSKFGLTPPGLKGKTRPSNISPAAWQAQIEIDKQIADRTISAYSNYFDKSGVSYDRTGVLIKSDPEVSEIAIQNEKDLAYENLLDLTSKKVKIKFGDVLSKEEEKDISVMSLRGTDQSDRAKKIEVENRKHRGDYKVILSKIDALSTEGGKVDFNKGVIDLVKTLESLFPKIYGVTGKLKKPGSLRANIETVKTGKSSGFDQRVR